MNYNVLFDLELALIISKFNYDEFAKALNIQKQTLINIINRKSEPSASITERVYNYIYKKGIYVYDVMSSIYEEELLDDDQIILYHGSKSEIIGEISLDKGRSNCDFGRGFYCGETYKQASSFVSHYPDSSVYLLVFNKKNMKSYTFHIDLEWLLAIAYYRGKFDQYKDSPKIKSIIFKLKGVDYIVAPITDNRMFTIIDRFLVGEMSDEQCLHSLAAVDLGSQYVFISQKAIDNLFLKERLYI